MTIATLNQKHFQQNDIPTRLNHLAAHLSQIQSLAQAFASEDKIVSLMRESLYYIEWTVPHIIDIDIDQAAELVDLGRILARWLFNWEIIWADTEARMNVALCAKQAQERVLEMPILLSQTTAE